jgi:hypothetical protein
VDEPLTLRASLARADVHGRLFVVVLALWLVLPFLPQLSFAQDAVPTVVAGELVVDEPDAVYGDGIYEMTPSFAERTCSFVPDDRSCDDLGVAFLAAPLSLPVAYVVALAPDGLAVATWRLVTAASFVFGMLVLWKRVAGRDPAMPRMLFFTALALTPFVIVSTVLGTSSALLFASAAFGLRHSDRPRRALAVAALWTANVVFRGFPALLGAVLLWQRRWWVLAWSAALAAILTLGWLLVGPASLFGDFVESTGEVAEAAPENIYNGSLDAALHQVAGSAADAASDPLVLAVRVLLVAAGIVALTRLRTPDARWAYAALVALLVVPLVWSHYLSLVVPAVAYALLERDRFNATLRQSRRVGTLPLAAAVVSLVAALSDVGESMVLVKFAVLVGALVAVPVLARVTTAGPPAEREGVPT